MELNGDGEGGEMTRFVVEALAASETEAPPAPLRERVLAGALQRRPAGRPAGVEALSPVEAYRRTVADLDEVLDRVAADPAGWSAVVEPYGWTVQGLVGHLVGIERLLATRLGVDDVVVPVDVEADHLAATHAFVDAAADRDPAETLAEWRAASARLAAVLTGPGAPDMDDRTTLHGVAFRWGALLVTRSLEVWTHTDDIRRAIGIPLAAPDPARLSLMTDLAVRSLPVRLTLTEEAAGTTGTIRIVLTGPGGGVWQQALGPGGEDGSDPDVRIVADAVGFCRLSAGRLSAADLDATVEGDAALGAAVFSASAAFAV